MSRIRSIHPRLFTDDAFMEASMAARVLFIGLWGECWDDGVFEWKPLSLKARLLPADNVDVTALLDELRSLNFVTRFDIGAKSYGVVRNFQKFQRPKKPNSSGVLTSEYAEYAGYSPAKSETAADEAPSVRNQFGTSTGNSPQKGGREEGRLPSQGEGYLNGTGFSATRVVRQ